LNSCCCCCCCCCCCVRVCVFRLNKKLKRFFYLFISNVSYSPVIEHLFTAMSSSYSSTSCDPDSPTVRCSSAFPDFFDPTTLSSLRARARALRGFVGRTGTQLVDCRSNYNGIQFKDDAGYIGYISDDDGSEEEDFRNMRSSSSSFGNLYHFRNQILGPDISFLHTFLLLCVLISFHLIVYILSDFLVKLFING